MAGTTGMRVRRVYPVPEGGLLRRLPVPLSAGNALSIRAFGQQKMRKTMTKMIAAGASIVAVPLVAAYMWLFYLS